MSEGGKDIFILGGPNGAGKTTAARVLLPESFRESDFLNADEIARGISPEDPESAAMAAGRELITRMRRLIQNGDSFALETTCSGRSYIPMLKQCKERGWSISLFYFWLPSPEASIARVSKRVAEGGHNIPAEVIYRRHRVGVWNMRHLYLPPADTAAIYDNGGEQRILIAEKELGSPLKVFDTERWSKMEELAL